MVEPPLLPTIARPELAARIEDPQHIKVGNHESSQTSKRGHRQHALRTGELTGSFLKQAKARETERRHARRYALDLCHQGPPFGGVCLQRANSRSCPIDEGKPGVASPVGYWRHYG